MSQKIPFQGGQARWYASTSFTTAAATLTTGNFLVAPSKAQVVDPGTSPQVKFFTGTAGTNATTVALGTASWLTNQWATRYWVYCVAGTGLGQRARITSNTATAITIPAVSVAFDTTSVFVITDDGMWGLPVAFTASGLKQSQATGGTSTTVVDGAQSWARNQFQDYEVSIIAGTNVGQRGIVISNTATTLTFGPAMSAAVDNTSVYQLLEPAGNKPILTDFEVFGSSTTTTGAATLKIESINLLGSSVTSRTLALGQMSNTQVFMSNCELFKPGGPNHIIRVTLVGWTGTGLGVSVNAGGYWVASGSAEGNAL